MRGEAGQPSSRPTYTRRISCLLHCSQLAWPSTESSEGGERQQRLRRAAMDTAHCSVVLRAGQPLLSLRSTPTNFLCCCKPLQLLDWIIHHHSLLWIGLLQSPATGTRPVRKILDLSSLLRCPLLSSTSSCGCKSEGFTSEGSHRAAIRKPLPAVLAMYTELCIHID